MEAQNEVRQFARIGKTFDLTNERFGRLTAIRCVGKRKGKKSWYCRCECGGEVTVRTNALLSGKTPSCGCIKSEKISKRHTTHGLTKSGVYVSWSAMRSRCNNPNATGYANYGGRGIRVYPEWDCPGEGFKRFLDYIGPRPAGHCIDRIDPDGNYEPGNIRWVTQAFNNKNMRKTARWTHNGVTKRVTEWADEYGIPYGALLARLSRHGWSFEDAISTPVADYDTKLTFNGRTQSRNQWAAEYSMSHETLRARLRLGWTVEEALTLPVAKKKYKDAGRNAAIELGPQYPTMGR